MWCFVLVGGWPGSGKSTLARGLAEALGAPYMSKNEIKESLMDSLGAPTSVDASRDLGRAAVFALLRVARGAPGAVLDSTWYAYTRPLVDALAGPKVEVRCRVPVEIARERYSSRSRDERHLDASRSEAELWGSEVLPLGMGPLVEVDTTAPVDLADLALRIRQSLAAPHLKEASFD